MSYAEGAYGGRSRVPLEAGRLLVCMKVAWRVCQSELIVLNNFRIRGRKVVILWTW